MKHQGKKKLIITSFIIFFLGMMVIFSLGVNDNTKNKIRTDNITNNSDLTTKGWSNVTKLSNYDSARNPSTVVDSSGNLHTIWTDDGVISYLVWNKLTATWHVKINNTDNLTTSTDYAKITIDSQDIPHIASLNSSGIFHIFWNTSSESWTTEIISLDTSLSDQDMAVDSMGNIHCVFKNNTNMYHRIWNASLKEWNIISPISGSTFVYNYLALAIDKNDNLHLAYQNGTINKNVHYKMWNSTTETWSANTLLSTDGANVSGFPDIAVDTEVNIHILWLNGSSTRSVLLRTYDAVSESWEAVQELASNITTYYSAIDADAIGNLHVVYKGNISTNKTINYQKWSKMTETWNTATIISANNSGTRDELTISSDSLGNVHVIWRDQTPDADLHPLGAAGYLIHRSFIIDSTSVPSSFDPLILLVIVLIIVLPAVVIVTLGFLYPRIKGSS